MIVVLIPPGGVRSHFTMLSLGARLTLPKRRIVGRSNSLGGESSVDGRLPRAAPVPKSCACVFRLHLSWPPPCSGDGSARIIVTEPFRCRPALAALLSEAAWEVPCLMRNR